MTRLSRHGDQDVRWWKLRTTPSKVIRRYGLNDPTEGAYLGHSLGFEVVEWPWFSSHARPRLLLEPGMVIAPEWFASTSQGVFPWEENFLVTETGLEKLSDFPQELCVVAD